MQRSTIRPPRVQRLPIASGSSSSTRTVEQPHIDQITGLRCTGQCSSHSGSNALHASTYVRDGVVDRTEPLSQGSRPSLDMEMSDAVPPLAAGNRLAFKGRLSFGLKLYLIVDDPSTSDIVTWCDDEVGFRILDHKRFQSDILPRICNGTYDSFLRQLGTYGFIKNGRDPRTKKGSERIMLSSRIYHLGGLFLKGRDDLASQIETGSGTTGPDQNLLLQQLQVALRVMQQSQNDLSQQLQDVWGQFFSLQSDHQTLHHNYTTLQQDNKATRYELQRVTEGYEDLWSAYKEQETKIESLQSASLSSWPGQASIDQRQSDALFEEYTHILSPNPSQKGPNDLHYSSAEPTAPNQQYNPHPPPVASTIIAQPTYSSDAGRYSHPPPALYDQTTSSQGYASQNPAPAVQVPPNNGTIDPSLINNAPTPNPHYTYHENGAHQPTSNANTINYQYDGPPDQTSRSYGAVAVPPSVHGGQPRQGTLFNMFGSPSSSYLAFFRS